jgi:membrane protease YdiL (CAAX protease family)
VEQTGPGIEQGIPEPEPEDAAGPGSGAFASPSGQAPQFDQTPQFQPTSQFQPTQEFQPAQPPAYSQLPPPVPPAAPQPPPQSPQPQPQPQQAQASPPRISPARAFSEIGAVYFVSFGLGVVSAVGLLTDPSLGSNQQVHGWIDAASEIMQYIMQASVVILGVGYFSLRRGLTLSSIFGRFSRSAPPAAPAWPAYQQQYPQAYPQQYPQQYAPQYQTNAYPGYPATPPYGQYPAYGYAPYMREPAQRGPAWQFSRAFFVSMAGVLAFLISVIIYVAISGDNTSAPDQGNSLWLIPVGAVVALAAGLGEEVLITGMVTTTLEQAGFARRAWVIYLVAIGLRIPFHLYYGWASLGVVCFTVVNIWVYRRWRLLWPVVLAHTAYDAIEFAGSLVPKVAGLALILLGLATIVMVIVIACIELSDRSARRRFNQWRTAVGSGY